MTFDVLEDELSEDQGENVYLVWLPIQEIAIKHTCCPLNLCIMINTVTREIIVIGEKGCESLAIEDLTFPICQYLVYPIMRL